MQDIVATTSNGVEVRLAAETTNAKGTGLLQGKKPCRMTMQTDRGKCVANEWSSKRTTRQSARTEAASQQDTLDFSCLPRFRNNATPTDPAAAVSTAHRCVSESIIYVVSTHAVQPAAASRVNPTKQT